MALSHAALSAAPARVLVHTKNLPVHTKILPVTASNRTLAGVTPTSSAGPDREAASVSRGCAGLPLVGALATSRSSVSQDSALSSEDGGLASSAGSGDWSAAATAAATVATAAATATASSAAAASDCGMQPVPGSAVPIVFIHGVGLGIVMYTELIQLLAATGGWGIPDVLGHQTTQKEQTLSLDLAISLYI
jgi:hypothetical protein